jgi:hypothetical protein
LTRYIAQIIAAGELMIIEVVIWSRGMPSKSVSISARLDTATPQVRLGILDNSKTHADRFLQMVAEELQELVITGIGD